MAQVMIGVDPHELSATIEVVDGHEKLLGSGRFSTDQVGSTAMQGVCERPGRSGCGRSRAVTGAGPTSARGRRARRRRAGQAGSRVRLFDTGHNRKAEAHSIAVVAVRTTTLRVLCRDGELEALWMLCDRREDLTRLRVQTVNRLQRLLAELIPGQAKKDLTALQAQAILAAVRPRDVAGKTRR